MKKLITYISVILAAILVALTLTACGSCNGYDEETSGTGDQHEGEFEVGGTVLGPEIDIPEDEQ